MARATYGTDDRNWWLIGKVREYTTRGRLAGELRRRWLIETHRPLDRWMTEEEVEPRSGDT